MHEKHRERVKSRFITSGLDDFAPHNVLELLLFYAIPQKDTNPLAHELINRFGSFAGVLDASVEELMTVDGIKENAAIYLKMFTSVFRVYEQSENQQNICYDTLEKIVKYAKTQFVGLTHERVYAMLLNNSLQILDCFMVSEGTVNSAPVVPRIIMQKALRLEASSLVLMHNHPKGIAVASPDDLRMTRVMEQACNVMGIYFLDHLIIAGDDYASVFRKSKGYDRPSPVTGAMDSNFFRAFYGDFEREQDDESDTLE